uniref:Uncharacterized protein n=1 Tax=Leersia perrieri TaxID=77586 RepID=A0A0D9WWM5_9ORYZ
MELITYSSEPIMLKIYFFSNTLMAVKSNQSMKHPTSSFARIDFPLPTPLKLLKSVCISYRQKLGHVQEPIAGLPARHAPPAGGRTASRAWSAHKREL